MFVPPHTAMNNKLVSHHSRSVSSTWTGIRRGIQIIPPIILILISIAIGRRSSFTLLRFSFIVIAPHATLHTPPIIIGNLLPTIIHQIVRPHVPQWHFDNLVRSHLLLAVIPFVRSKSSFPLHKFRRTVIAVSLVFESGDAQSSVDDELPVSSHDHNPPCISPRLTEVRSTSAADVDDMPFGVAKGVTWGMSLCHPTTFSSPISIPRLFISSIRCSQASMRAMPSNHSDSTMPNRSTAASSSFWEV
mmetsp:Transcript_36332/g.76557  ORF Transcript_36332/g.76557 Transcript_36332/m.76557 type:complete len:246 (+) Transcript_36332:2840-3577(+)